MTPLKTFALTLGLTLTAGAVQAATCNLPGNEDQLTAVIAQGLNATRAAYGLPALAPDRRLTEAAVRHGCDMSVNGFFGHQGSDGGNSQARVRSTGYAECLVAENLAWGYPDATEIVPRWMGSPGHRDNILLPRAEEFGTAVVMGADGPIWVLVMARPC